MGVRRLDHTMRQIAYRLLQIFGIVLLVLGVIFIGDGLLPLRSHGPNPSWVEVAAGVTFTVIGWILRRHARNRLQRAIQTGGI